MRGSRGRQHDHEHPPPESLHARFTYQDQETDDEPIDGLRKARRAAAIVNVRTHVDRPSRRDPVPR
jgi:hypothetical protein